METAEIKDALGKCEVLASADDAELNWLAEAGRSEFLEADGVLFTEGDTSTRVYVVVTGSLQVRQGESCKLVSFAEAGTLFGEYAMFAKGARTANVVAADPTILLSFPEERFREFLLKCPAVMMKLLQTAVRRLHRVGRQRG
jgi:CRP-like cAMP-binding protein